MKILHRQLTFRFFFLPYMCVLTNASIQNTLAWTESDDSACILQKYSIKKQASHILIYESLKDGKVSVNIL